MAGGLCHRPFFRYGILHHAETAQRQIIVTVVALANRDVCATFRLLPSERPNEQVTKLGNADGLLVY